MQGVRGAPAVPVSRQSLSAVPPASDAFASEAICSIKIKMPLPQLALGLKSSVTSGQFMWLRSMW